MITVSQATALPGPHLGARITFDPLPAKCQSVVLSDLKELE